MCITNLHDNVLANGFICVECRRGMYGLPQSEILAQQLPEKHLATKCYHQGKIMHGFWTHKWRLISLRLVVNDFRVKYVGEEHAQNLLDAIKEHYKCKAE